MHDDPQSPLTALDFAVLLVLSEGISYGYGIMKAVARPSHGGLELAPGNIYQGLDRLISRGWIRELGRSEIPRDADVRRRYYAITKEGSRAASLEARRLYGIMPAMRRSLHALPGEG